MSDPTRPDSTADGRVLPDVTSDERAVGWGDDLSESDDDDDARFTRERPPHHDRD